MLSFRLVAICADSHTLWAYTVYSTRLIERDRSSERAGAVKVWNSNFCDDFADDSNNSNRAAAIWTKGDVSALTLMMLMMLMMLLLILKITGFSFRFQLSFSIQSDGMRSRCRQFLYNLVLVCVCVCVVASGQRRNHVDRFYWSAAAAIS